MAKEKGPFSALVSLLVWIAGVLVSLAVGFAMTGNGPLNQTIPYLSTLGNGIVVAVAGWIVVILTLVSVILAIVDKLK